MARKKTRRHVVGGVGDKGAGLAISHYYVLLLLIQKPSGEPDMCCDDNTAIHERTARREYSPQQAGPLEVTTSHQMTLPKSLGERD
jgi:hypothetical protein